MSPSSGGTAPELFADPAAQVVNNQLSWNEAPPGSLSLMDMTPFTQRGCRSRDHCGAHVSEDLLEVLFGDTLICMQSVPTSDPATLVSCTLLSCLALTFVCGVAAFSNGLTPVESTLVEWPRLFLDYYLRLLVEGHSVVAEKMLRLVDVRLVELRKLTRKYDGLPVAAKYGFSPRGLLNHPPTELLEVVDDVIRFRQLFQWHFNFLNVACLRWTFLENCEHIEFESHVPRFYRVKVVGDLLVSYWKTRLAERDEGREPVVAVPLFIDNIEDIENNKSQKIKASVSSPTKINIPTFHFLNHTYLDPQMFDFSSGDFVYDHMSGRRPSVPESERMEAQQKRLALFYESMEYGLAAPSVQGLSVTFVEVGVFQGRLAYEILKLCPFVRYFGVDPYRFENNDFEFQGLFTDKIDDSEVEVTNATSPTPAGTATGVQNTITNVDYHSEMLEAREGARHKIGRFGSRATLIEKPSKQVAGEFEDGSVDFAFIDADHSYDATYEDLELWWPKVKLGGILGGHDFGNNPQVTRAVVDFARKHIGLHQKIRVDADWVWYWTRQTAFL